MKDFRTLSFNQSNKMMESTSLELIAEKISDGIHLTPNYMANGEYYFINGNNLVNGRIAVSEKTKKVSFEEFQTHSKPLIDGSILLSINGTIGNTAIYAGEKVLLGKSACFIILKSTMNSKFIYYLLNSPSIKRYFLSELTGTTIKNLSLATIKKTTVHLPDNIEQQKIADFLTAVDTKVSQLTEKHRLLKEYKKGVMQQLFSQQIRFKDDDGKAFPEWEEFRLSEITVPIKRKAKNVIDNVMSISAGKGFLHQKERFSQIIAGTSLDKYTHIKKGEFAYNRGNSKSYTYGCIYQLDDEEALVPFVYRSFKLKKGIGKFYAQLFAMKYLDRQLRRMISSSARMDGLLNIGEKDFYQAKVPFPCEAEQQKIALFLQSIDTKIAAVAEQVEQTQQFKKGLLQQMFV